MSRDDDMQKVATFMARLLYAGIPREQAVTRAYDFAVAQLSIQAERQYRLDEQGGSSLMPDLMRDASFLLVGAVKDAEKWLAVWKSQEKEEAQG